METHGTNRSWRALGVLTALIVLTACARDSQPQPQQGAAASATPSLVGTPPRPPGALTDWIAEMRGMVKAVPPLYAKDVAGAQRAVLDVYINRQEYVEIFYGEAGRVSQGGPLGEAVMSAERMFHDLMTVTGATPKAPQATVVALVDTLDMQLATIARIAVDSKVLLTPPDSSDVPALSTTETTGRMDEVIALVAEARALYAKGDVDAARRMVEQAYLEKFEPVEAVLPAASVARVEELVHMRLRPRLASNGKPAEIDSLFALLHTELESANKAGSAGRTAWFGSLSAFFIIVREGLEAVLLIAAMVAYLSRTDDARAQRRNVYVGAGVGLIFTFITWLLARTLIPITGGSRELMEGITALVAVAVLLYVSHWIFRRTYMGGWRKYLHGKVQHAVNTGSGFAIAGLSFAAVYREGFETVLFYEALLVDQPGSSVALGFASGALLIAIVGFAIIRAGLKLPLAIVFRATNIVLLFLSVAILGKGLYNLQEAGLFNPHPLEWLPSSEILSQILGFYPMAETLLAQLALVTLVAVMYLVYRRRIGSRVSEAAA